MQPVALGNSVMKQGTFLNVHIITTMKSSTFEIAYFTGVELQTYVYILFLAVLNTGR